MYGVSDDYLTAITTPMHEIEPGLWLGNYAAASDVHLLRSHNIKAIVQCLDQRNPINGNYFSYHVICIDDLASVNIKSHIPEAISFIHRHRLAGNNVLVHCAAGMSRSASIMISYMMAKYKLPFERALTLVRSKRACVSPNPGFTSQLRSLSLDKLAEYLTN